MRKVRSLVIGGGPSGLAVAYGLQDDTLILERESTVGGLCRSIRHDDAVFDIGGHSFHTPHFQARELVQQLLDGRMHVQQRDARVYVHGVLIPYPFQKSYERIPDPAVVRDCAEGLSTAEGPAGAENFEEYLIGKFGQGIAQHFLLPYNRKLWARDIREMSIEWTSERVAAPKGVAERFETAGDRRRPLQATTHVGYPTQGGFEEIYKTFVPHVPGIRLNSRVVRIDPRARVARTAQGEEYGWEILVSTMPLPALVRIVDGTPDEIKALAGQLDFLSLRVEFLLAGRQLDTPIQRIYVADPDIPPHKIVLNHNSSAHLRALPQHAIMAEVSISPGKPVDVHDIAPKTIAFLCERGILNSADEVVWQGHVDVEYAYPVYTHRRLDLVEGIKAWMQRHSIYTLGRFGDWEYVNSDRCIVKGLNLAQTLLNRWES